MLQFIPEFSCERVITIGLHLSDIVEIKVAQFFIYKVYELNTMSWLVVSHWALFSLARNRGHCRNLFISSLCYTLY